MNLPRPRVKAVKKRSPERAVEALERIRRELVEGIAGQSYQVTVYEITKVVDAWTAGDPWEERLVELADRRRAHRKAGS